MTRFMMLLFSFVLVVPEDIDPFCSKFIYLNRYTNESEFVEKYYISIKDTDVISGNKKVYFGDGLYRKFRGLNISIACYSGLGDSIVINEYNFEKLHEVISSLNYGFNEMIMLYNPSESYDNLYYHCIGKKFSEFISKRGYKVNSIPVDTHAKLADVVSKIRSNRTIHLLNNSIDYIGYKGKTVHNSSISRFILDNTDNVIIISFSYYHCKSGIAHICLDADYHSFKEAVDSVLSGKAKGSVIVNNRIYINSSLFKFFHSPDIDYIISIVSEVF